MRKIIAILFALSSSPIAAETSNRAALQGAGANHSKILVVLKSAKACEAGTSKAEILVTLHDVVRASWRGQDCEIAGTPGQLVLVCSPPPGTPSPLAGAIYRESSPTTDGACSYECTGNCGKYAPPTLLSTAPILFDVAPSQ